MPLDDTSRRDDAESDIDILSQRRQDCAALWRSVPRENFAFNTFCGTRISTSRAFPPQTAISDGQCGTMACALGWLALQRVDGWNLPVLPQWDRYSYAHTYQAAALYFGLYELDAVRCFSASPSMTHYGCGSLDVTAEQVAAMLLSMPYCTTTVRLGNAQLRPWSDTVIAMDFSWGGLGLIPPEQRADAVRRVGS